MRIEKTIDEAMKIKTLAGEEQRGMDSTDTNQILEQIYIQYAAQKYIDSVKERASKKDMVRTA